MEKDELTLKWGTLKGWHFQSLGENGEGNPALNEAIDRFNEHGSSMSAMMQDRTGAHSEIVCDIIDACNLDEVYLDWDGKYVTKEEAKEYVRNYGK